MLHERASMMHLAVQSASESNTSVHVDFPDINVRSREKITDTENEINKRREQNARKTVAIATKRRPKPLTAFLQTNHVEQCH